jgi:hypothetical protein
MMNIITTIEDAIDIAETRWCGLEFKRKNYHEASSACPFCRDGKDRFLIFSKGNYWCRQCGVGGSLLIKDPNHRLTPQEINEIRLARIEREQEEQAKRLSALERMAASKDHLRYHEQLDDADRAYWYSQGIFDAEIDAYTLGVCYRCPTDRDHRPSYTIPVVNHGKLCNIRHRLLGAEDGDKYRPHMAGLGNTLFNADNLYTDAGRIILAEGEKKSIVLGSNGFLSVAMMGIQSFPPPWARRFSPFDEVLVTLDPDASNRANKIAALFAGRGKVVYLPVKADDFFVLGGTRAQFEEYLKWAKPVD